MLGQVYAGGWFEAFKALRWLKADSKVVLLSRRNGHFHLLGRLSSILGYLGDFLGHLRESWGSFGAIVGHLGVIFGHLGAILGHLGVIFF